jgi:MFS family permease
VFQQLLATNKIERTPIVEVFKKQPREIFLSALLRMAEQAPFYIFTAFIFAHGTATLHMSRNLILAAVLVASCVPFITIPISGHISDRIGRRKMYLIGAAATGLFSFLYFGLPDTAIPSAIFIAIVLSLIPYDMMYGPQAALIAEASRHGCAIAARHWATSLLRSLPGARRRSSRPPCLQHTRRATPYRSTSPAARW